MTTQDLALALLRTTLATAAAACLATLLLAGLKVQSPRTHRIAWLLVILQGWLLIPWTLRLEAPPSAAPALAPTIEGAMPSSAWAWTESPLLLTDQITVITPPPEPPRRFADVAAPATLVAWLAGAAAVALAAAWRYLRILRTLPLGATPDDPQWQAEWRRARQGLAHFAESAEQYVPVPFPRVDLRITASLGPLLAFIPWRYLILAPRTLWTALASSEREAILRHELAHLHRRDLWKSLALRALALPQWFNPLAWLAVRRFDEAAEWACDAEAARHDSAAPLTLAQSLVRSAELLQTTPSAPAAAGLSFQGGVLSRRVQRLVTPRFKEESTMKRLAVPLLLTALAAAQLIRIERVAAEHGPEFEISNALGEPIADDGEPAPAPPMTVAEWMAQPRTDDVVQPTAARAAAPVPHELKKVTLPIYVVEPPDIVLIEGVRLVPKLPYRIQNFDVLTVRFPGDQENDFTDVNQLVNPDGKIHLGFSGKIHPGMNLADGLVAVAGLTLDEAQAAIRKQIGGRKAGRDVTVFLREVAVPKDIAGQHLVAMDGRINLGVYGSVFVAGKTIAETQAAIEKQLADQFDAPQVSVDVLAYNSKVYYIITEGGDQGDDVVRVPITGNETVLDAIATLGGMPIDGDVKIHVSRPAPNGVGAEQILPVVWHEIARGLSTATNYQLLPGDRLFIEPQRPIKNPQAPPIPVGAVETADLVGWNAPVPRGQLLPLLGPVTSGDEIVTLEPPSDDEILRVLKKARPDRAVGSQPAGGAKAVRIVKEKTADFVDAPRDYPLVGPAQQHHAHYKCTIVYEDSSEVIYIDHNHLHMAPRADAGEDSRQGLAPNAVERPQAPPVPVCATETADRVSYSDSPSAPPKSPEDQARDEAHRLEPYDVLDVTVTKPYARPVSTPCVVQASGDVLLNYQHFKVGGLTLAEARKAISDALSPGGSAGSVNVQLHHFGRNRVAVRVSGKGIKYVNGYYLPEGTSKGHRVSDVLKTIVTDFDIDAAWVVHANPRAPGYAEKLEVHWLQNENRVADETDFELSGGDQVHVAVSGGPQNALAATPVDAAEPVPPAAYRAAAKKNESPQDALKRQRAVHISLRMPDGRSVERAEQIADGATIGQVLNDAKYPYPVDLAKALITVSRVSRIEKNGRSVEARTTWAVGWDAKSHSAVGADNGPLQPGDQITIDLSPPPATPVIQPKPKEDHRGAAGDDESSAETTQSQPVVFLSLSTADGKKVEWPVELTAGATIGQVLNDATYPHPVDFDKALISLSRHSRGWNDGHIAEVRKTWAIDWDAKRHAPPIDDNHELQPGDAITIEIPPSPYRSRAGDETSIDPLTEADLAGRPVKPITASLENQIRFGSAPADPTRDDVPAPSMRAGELRIHDIITVLADYRTRAKDGHADSFRIACEITEIRPNGNLRIEGQQTIHPIHGSDEQWRISLSGEVRRESVQPDRTVSSDSIVNLDIKKQGPKPVPLEFRIALVEDVSGDLADFDGLGKNSIAVGDSSTILAALKVFKRHELVKTLADPVLRTNVGRGAAFNFATPAPDAEDGGPNFRVATHVLIVPHTQPAVDGGRALLLELAAGAQRQAVDLTFSINEGQSAIVKLHPRDGAPAGHPVYVVVTPTWLE